MIEHAIIALLCGACGYLAYRLRAVERDVAELRAGLQQHKLAWRPFLDALKQMPGRDPAGKPLRVGLDQSTQ